MQDQARLCTPTPLTVLLRKDREASGPQLESQNSGNAFACSICQLWFLVCWWVGSERGHLDKKMPKARPCSSKDRFLYLSFQLNVEFLKTKMHRTPLRTTFNLLNLFMCIRSSQVTAKDQAYLHR